MQYIAFLETTSDELPVPRIDFECASDKMAIEFASKTHRAYLTAGYLFKKCTVFRIGERRVSSRGVEESDQAHVATFLMKYAPQLMIQD